MEKELTKKDEINQIREEFSKREKELYEKYKNVRCGRDGGETKELIALHKEECKRYAEIEEKYANKHSE